MSILVNGEHVISRRVFIAGATCLTAAVAAGGLFAAKSVSDTLGGVGEAAAHENAGANGSAEAASLADSSTLLWFSPHQDDESLVFAAGILADVADGRDVQGSLRGWLSFRLGAVRQPSCG